MPPRDSPGGILSFELLCFSYHIYFNFIKLSCFSLSLIFPKANQNPTPQNEIYPAPYPPRMFSLPSGTLPLHGSCHARQIEFPFPALHNTSFINQRKFRSHQSNNHSHSGYDHTSHMLSSESSLKRFLWQPGSFCFYLVLPDTVPENPVLISEGIFWSAASLDAPRVNAPA